MWQSRYYSCPVEERYLWSVLSYVERNPVRAALVSTCEDWPWSSARSHLGLAGRDTWLSSAEWDRHWTHAAWRDALTDGLEEASLRARLAEATATGRPLGEAGFIEDCEKRFGLILRRQKPGPKPKVQNGVCLRADSAGVGQLIRESW